MQKVLLGDGQSFKKRDVKKFGSKIGGFGPLCPLVHYILKVDDFISLEIEFWYCCITVKWNVVGIWSMFTVTTLKRF